MSNKNALTRIAETVRQAAPLGAVVLGGMLPAGAAATENYNPHGAHNERMPADVEMKIRRDTVFLKGLGCSGQALRNKNNEVIGVVTAEHCSLTNEKNERISGNDGNTYIVQPEPVGVFTGAHKEKMKKAATIVSYIVPGKNDKNHDLALGVAAGHKPSEVLEAYNKQAMTVEELSKLRAGAEVWMGGYPDYNSRFERQIFKMNLKGFGRIPVDTKQGAVVDLLWADVSSTNDGATCSYGNSGAVGIVKVDGKLRSIGVLSAFHDLKGGVPAYVEPGSKTYPTYTPQLRGQNKTADCGFSYNLQTPREGAQIIRVKKSASEIPGYVTPEQAVENARADFKNPQVAKTILHADIYLTGKDGLGSLVKDAAIFRNKRLGYNVFAQADANDPDHLKFTYLKDKQLNTMTVYALDANTKPSFLSSQGLLEYTPPAPKAATTEQTVSDAPDSKPPQQQMVLRQSSGKGGGPELVDTGHFTDENGLEIGGTDLGQPYYQDGYYNLEVNPNNGELQIVHNKYNGGK